MYQPLSGNMMLPRAARHAKNVVPNAPTFWAVACACAWVLLCGNKEPNSSAARWYFPRQLVQHHAVGMQDIELRLVHSPRHAVPPTPSSSRVALLAPSASGNVCRCHVSQRAGELDLGQGTRQCALLRPPLGISHELRLPAARLESTSNNAWDARRAPLRVG